MPPRPGGPHEAFAGCHRPRSDVSLRVGYVHRVFDHDDLELYDRRTPSRRFAGPTRLLTVQLGEELRDTPIVVTSVSPGYVKTELTGHKGFLTAEEGARLPVEHALLGADAVSGRFVEASGETPW